jgi:hypothetical protein
VKFQPRRPSRRNGAPVGTPVNIAVEGDRALMGDGTLAIFTSDDRDRAWPLLVSTAFAEAMGEARSRLVSVGRYALRGVGRPQELFTVEF